MAKASINFKAAKSNSKAHNEREYDLDYAYSDLSSNNEMWKADEIETRKKEIQKLCKDLSGRKMQKNATPIREAVVNLNSTHTMDDLKELANKLQEQKGIECFQIFIHRDEGKSREDLNYHAHMLFDWQDKETGKMKRLNKIDMSQIQDLVSETLHMERGELRVNSNRQRLEPIEYKRQQEELKLQELQKQVKLLEQKKNRAAQANREAREEYQRHQEQDQAHRKRFKQRSEELARKGIPMDWKSVKGQANAISAAVKLQQEWADNQAKEIETIEARHREVLEEYLRTEKLYNEATSAQAAIERNEKSWKAVARLRSEIEQAERE